MAVQHLEGLEIKLFGIIRLIFRSYENSNLIIRMMCLSNKKLKTGGILVLQPFLLQINFTISVISASNCSGQKKEKNSIPPTHSSMVTMH